MDDLKIYVVFGATGEYSDRSEWNVVALHSKEAAEKYAEACMTEAQRIVSYNDEFGKSYRDYKYDSVESPEWIKHKFDPQFYCDYTDRTNYSVSEVPLHFGKKTLQELEAERTALELRLVMIDKEMEGL